MYVFVAKIEFFSLPSSTACARARVLLLLLQFVTILLSSVFPHYKKNIPFGFSFVMLCVFLIDD
jgi:hypothetical protein